MSIIRILGILAVAVIVFLGVQVTVMSQQLLTVREVFNKVWDKAGSRLMTTPWAGAQQQFETETTILNNVYDASNMMLRVSGGGGGGSGDVSSNTATSVDSEVVLFSGTGGKTIQRATGSGIAVVTDGVLSTAVQPASAIVGVSDTQTLTNKRVNPRVVTLTDASLVTPNGDTTDEGVLLTVSQATQFANPTGTPVNAQMLVLRVTSSVARALTWGSVYAANSGLTLPTTTTGGGIDDYFGFRYNSGTSKWDFVATSVGTTVGDVTGSSLTTFTNKTLDVEGTGNIVTIVERIWLPAAICRNATAEMQWDTPTSSPAVAACITGTNTQKGVADFADGADLSMQTTRMLPIDWVGAIDVSIKWLSANNGGDVVWQIQTACVADAETDDPAFNTASTVADTAKATINQTNDAVIAAITTTGCVGGELLHLRLRRNSGDAGDNHGGTARFIGMMLTLRRAQ